MHNYFNGGATMSRDNFEIVMEEIIAALKGAGYDPRKQINDYIQTGKLQYITRHNCARNKIATLSTTMVWQYINKSFS